mmetsp:Transcript_31261/g.45661  ORF Transcript_31261/g.45661 Transcript_31261/m.45661 type:complete len:113 (+) Transcript_31261:354-692(+)
MASTTIQDSLTLHHNNLELDNYFCLGKANRHYAKYFEGRQDVYRGFMFGCFIPPNNLDSSECLKGQKRFTQVLQGHLQAGHNVILSEETISVHDILEKGWELKKNKHLQDLM